MVEQLFSRAAPPLYARPARCHSAHSTARRERLIPIAGTVPNPQTSAGGLLLLAALSARRRGLSPREPAARFLDGGRKLACTRPVPVAGRRRDPVVPYRRRPAMTPLIEVHDLVRIYQIRRGASLAARPRCARRRCLARSCPVKRSASWRIRSGKSTLGRMLLGIDAAQQGRCALRRGSRCRRAQTAEWRALRAKMQLVYPGPACRARPTPNGRARNWLSRGRFISSFLGNIEGARRRTDERQSAYDRTRPSAIPHELVRRPASASRDRPRDGLAAKTSGLRRAGFGARCFHPGADRQHAARPSGTERHRHGLHQPRPQGGAQHRRSRLRCMYLGRIVEEASSDVIFRSPHASLHQGAGIERTTSRHSASKDA